MATGERGWAASRFSRDEREFTATEQVGARGLKTTKRRHGPT